MTNSPLHALLDKERQMHRRAAYDKLGLVVGWGLLAVAFFLGAALVLRWAHS